MAEIELLKISSKKRKQTVEDLIESSSPTHSFFLILILSAVITTFGLLLNSAAIVIGGMLVSPLLSPILAISMGIVMADGKLILRSLRVLAIAIVCVVAISLIFAFFMVDKTPNNEIISRIHPNFIYFGVALASGIAAAFAFSKEEFSKHLVGVAVAIALLPPLSVIGIGIAFWNLEVLSGSIALFLINLFGILLGSLVVFSLLRFYPEKKVAEKELKEEERELEKNKNNNNK